jgi:hypothetical protein
MLFYRIFNNIISCTVGAVKEECGSEIGEVFLRMFEKSFDFIMSQMPCTMMVTSESFLY